jgi:two-component sensor histidine kinase
LIEEGWHGASLAELVDLQLRPFLECPDRRSIEGPTVLLKPEAAQALGLALHELASNAKRFGAPVGAVRAGVGDMVASSVSEGRRTQMGGERRPRGESAGGSAVWQLGDRAQSRALHRR